MIKYSTYSGVGVDGSPRIHLVEPGTRYGLSETDGLSKTASGEHLPEVMELIESIAPQPGRMYLVNSALAAGEVVGFNKRGDWFTEAGLVNTPPGWEDIPVWDIEARRKAANHSELVPGYGMCAWGYPTFYNAHRFKHHVNKDPNKAYGFILGAFWDERMKRVILVSELIKDMCMQNGGMDVYEKIQAGFFPDSSMGSKVPYDRCSICGHKAISPAEYCIHTKKGAPAPYGMRSILPDGRRCGVYNDQPRFFDDSFVFVGAERSAKIMSDVTPLVAGENTYTQTIFPFSPRPVPKLASVPESTVSIAPNRLDSHPDKNSITEEMYQQKLQMAAQHMPISSPLEKSALSFFVDKKLKQESLRRGSLDLAMYSQWELSSKQAFVQQYGIPVDHFKYIEEQLDEVHNDIFKAQKVAHVKWAEMYKRIPNDPETISIARSQTKGFKCMPTDALEILSANPHESLRAMARHGIVAMPKEFQFIMLRRKFPELAKRLHSRGIVFGPQRMPENFSPFLSTNSIAPAILDVIKPFIQERSFAPKAVRIRMTKRIVPNTEVLKTANYPLLDEVGGLYNSYRAGLMEASIKFDDSFLAQNSFSSDLVKEAELNVASDNISKLLLGTSYWSSVTNNFPFMEER